VSPSINREVYKKEVEELEKVVPIAITPERRKSGSFLKYASIAVLALTLGGWFSSNYYLGQIEQHNQLAQEEANKQIENRVQEATFVIDNPLPAINFNVTKQSGNFHIVAGAFRVEENSRTKVKQLKAEGFKARKIGVNKYGLHEVVYGSYETRKEALKALRDIKRAHDQDAWLKVQSINVNETDHIMHKALSEKIEQFGQSQIHSNSGKNQINAKSNSIFDNSPSVIPIYRDITNLGHGFYTVIGVFTDESERDSFLSNLEDLGHSNINYFYNNKSQSYFVYNGKFEDVASAKYSLSLERNASFKDKIAVIKVEN